MALFCNGAQECPLAGSNYALVIGRTFFSDTTPQLNALPGVALTVRNMAVDLVSNGFNTVVLADTPMALTKPAFDEALLEEHYATQATNAKQRKDLRWFQAEATRGSIQEALDRLSAMVTGHSIRSADQLLVYICTHGVRNACDQSYGATLADVRCTKTSAKDANGNDLPATFEGAYTMEQLREDLGVNTTRLWRNILVVLDTCSSADAFGATDVSKHARGITVTPEMEEFKQHESYQCLAAAPCRSAAFCFDHGTALHTALRRAWLSSDEDGGAFSRGREGTAQWATIACVADRVSVELATLMKEAQQRLPDDQRRPDDNYVLRQSCLLGRLSWRKSDNTGEFLAFNKRYTERNKLAMVPPALASFTGRVKELEDLKNLLHPSSETANLTVRVSAAGGVGKSALAAEYARQNEHKYHCILWVHGANAKTMIGSYREAVKLEYIQLADVDAETAKNKEVVAAVKKWLALEQGWLMVVDGCDNITEEMEKMMPCGVVKGKMIVTTRLQEGPLFNRENAPLRLGLFKEDEAKSYMMTRLHNRTHEKEELMKIVEKLGGMPLALELAAAYLAKMPATSAKVYLERLERDVIEALKENGGGGGQDLKDRVVATYKPSIALAMKKGGEAIVRKMVGVMGFLEGSAIEVEVLRWLVMGQRNKEKEEEDAFDVALGELCQLSVVDVNRNVVSLHLLVQDVFLLLAFKDAEERARSRAELLCVVWCAM